MTERKVFLTVIAGLVILNMAMLGFFLTSKPHRPHNHGQKLDMNQPENPMEHIKTHFEFSDQQEQLFDASRNTHRTQIASLNKELALLSHRYYNYDESFDPIAKSALLDSIQLIYKQFYTVNDLHFTEMYNFCTEEQKPKVNEFVDVLLGNKPRKK